MEKLNEKEGKLLRLALCPGAQPGEVSAAAEKFFTSLRRRGVTAEELIRGPVLGLSKAKRVGPGDLRFPFGRYRGQRIRDVPVDYLDWVLSTVEGHSHLIRAIHEFLRTSEEVAT